MRHRMFYRMLGLRFVLVLGLICSVTAQAEALWTDAQMRSAIESFHGKLELTVWQQRLYLEEILPQARKFIRPEPPAGVGPAPAPVVNAEKIRSYLQFFVSPGAISAPKIMLYLEAAEDCAKCKSSEHMVRNLTHARMERRGFNPIWLSAHEFPPSRDALVQETSVQESAIERPVGSAFAEQDGELLADADLEVPVSERVPASTKKERTSAEIQAARAARMKQLELWMARKDAAALLWVHWSPTVMEVQFVSPEGRQFSKQKVFTDGDKLASIEADLLNDLYIDLALESQRNPASLSAMPEQEVWIRLSRVVDFAELGRIQGLISAEIKDFVSFKVKRITRGEHVFAVQAKAPKEVIKTQLEAAKIKVHNELGPARHLQFSILEANL